MLQDNSKTVIEALLFASENPLTPEKIKTVLDNLDTAKIRKIIEELISEYAGHNQGIHIIEIAGGFQMVTNPSLSPFLKKLYKERRVERLSRAALETLAVIAYKQPISRLQIESLRSVNVDGLIKGLIDKEFIRITGRKKAPGRPYVYGTTRQFLEYFGLRSLADLPKMEEFLAHNNSRLVLSQDEWKRGERTERGVGKDFPHAFGVTGSDSDRQRGKTPQ